MVAAWNNGVISSPYEVIMASNEYFWIKNKSSKFHCHSLNILRVTGEGP